MYFQVPFTTFSTLNAVITFADVQNVKFKTIHTDKHSFIWHAIGDRFVIIIYIIKLIVFKFFNIIY